MHEQRANEMYFLNCHMLFVQYRCNPEEVRPPPNKITTHNTTQKYHNFVHNKASHFRVKHLKSIRCIHLVPGSKMYIILLFTET